ncbi:MAG: DUF6261 family protein [Tannerella sp.]|jgi:hypothetical protein|nr:DUF6261 family protein [Tannerella sp.]
MATELRKPDMGHYSNADHIEFHKMSDNLFDRYKNVINDPELIAGYRAKVTQEDHIYKWLRRSELTGKKAKTDREREKILSGIVGLLHSFEKYFDPSLRDNAKHVLNLIGDYRSLTHADYDAETAGIDRIVENLNSAGYLPAVQNLQLAPWLTELARLNTLFKSYAADTEQEQVKKPGITTRAARRETDGAFRKITLRITSVIDLGLVDETVYKPLVKEFNVHADHYNTLLHEHYGRLHVKTDISQSEIEPVEVQQYTGKPVYVIPSVKVRRTGNDGTVTVIELKFSEDFTAGYKNNTGPGTATLTLTGAGKYTGEIVTTFNIATGDE